MTNPSLQILPDSTVGGTGLYILLRDSNGNAPDELIAKSSITRIGGVYERKTNQYGYPTKTVVTLEIASRQAISIECQTVTNQPTWNDGTLAALNAAISEIPLI